MNYSRRFFPGLAVALLVAGCATFDGGNSTWRDAERPLVNAHRGGTFEYDDNALGGFRRCLAAGVRGFETDVQLTKWHVDLAARLGCSYVAPLLRDATAELVDYAHAKGMGVTVWMVQDARDYGKAKAIGADTGTSDYPLGLLKDLDKEGL